MKYRQDPRDRDKSRRDARRRVRPVIDVSMALAYLFQMMPGKTGNPLHELGGVVLMALFVAHHLLNHGWVRRFTRQRTTRARLLLAGDVALAACMVGTAVTGLLMARTLPLPHVDGIAHVVRSLHAWCAYVGFMLVALHVGLHLRAMAGYAHARLAGGKGKAPVILPVSLAVGGWAFVRLDVLTRLRLGMSFPDGVTPVALLVVEHLALALPFVVLGALIDMNRKTSRVGSNHDPRNQ